MTIINIASKRSIYIIPGSKSYTLRPEIYTPVDMDLLDNTGLDSIQRDLDVLIVSDNNTALRQYLSNKTLQGTVSAESIQDLMAATLTNSVYDDEGNTISVGGSGGGSLEPAGDWDIANSAVYTGEGEIFLRLENAYGCSIVNNTAVSGTGNEYPFAGGSVFGYAASTLPTVINDFSTTKWVTISMINYGMFMLYDGTGITNPVTEMMFTALGSTVPTETLTIGYSSISGLEIYVMDELGGVYAIAMNSDISLSGVTDISIGINVILGELYVDNGVDAIYTLGIPQTLFSGAQSLEFLAGGFYGGAHGVTSGSAGISETPGVAPITEIAGSAVTVAPEPAEDGQLWNIISTGAYDGKALRNGDSVIFFNNKENIIAITHPDTDLIVSTAITNALAEDGEITLAIDQILATKHFNSYAGEWFAGGQYDGSLTFIPFTSYTTYGQNTLSVTGAGDVQSDGKYWGLIRDAAATIPVGALSVDVILPFMQYGPEELVFEMREAGTFGDLSANQKFFRFSFINIDDTGFSPIMQLTITYCDGGNNVVTAISPTTISTGDRVVFSVSQNVATAYRYTTGAWDDLGSASPSFTAATFMAYIGFGREFGGVNTSFVVTMGSKSLILPPEPRAYKTYKAIGTDGYSQLYNKTIKDNDLVTFIIVDNAEDILVEPAADLSLMAYKRHYYGMSVFTEQASPLSMNIAYVELSNITERVIQISNFNLIQYIQAGDPFTLGLTIRFNRTDPNVNLDFGRSYLPGETIQVAFDTRGGNAIENIYFEDWYYQYNTTQIVPTGPVAVAAEKYTVFTFAVMAAYGETYGTKFRLVSKVEL